MKKITFYLILFTLFVSIANAQDTIRTQDMPAAGSIYTLSIGQTFPGLDVIGTGANYTWDFTQLGRTSQRVDTMLDPAQTDQLLSFFFINIPFNTNRSNVAQKGGSFNLGTTGLDNVFNYYYNSQSSFEQVGIGATITGLPIPIAFTPHDVVYKFPLKFGDEDSVAFNYELDLSAALGLFYSVDKKRHNLVDGWGTLKTPFGTFNTIRVKSVVIEQDSVYIDTFNLGLNLPQIKTIEYKWLSPGKGLPLLQINTTATNQINQILYQDSTRTIGIEEIPSIISDANVFPNPANEKLFVKYNLLQQGKVSFQLFSTEGKLIFVIDEQSSFGDNFKSIDLKSYNIPSGNYFLKIHTTGSEIVKPVTIY